MKFADQKTVKVPREKKTPRFPKRPTQEQKSAKIAERFGIADLMSRAEAMKYLDISNATMHKYHSQMYGVKMGREIFFRKENLDSWMAEHRIKFPNFGTRKGKWKNKDNAQEATDALISRNPKKAGEITAQVFKALEEGVSLRQIIIEHQLTTETAERFFSKWSAMGGCDCPRCAERMRWQCPKCIRLALDNTVGRDDAPVRKCTGCGELLENGKYLCKCGTRFGEVKKETNG